MEHLNGMVERVRIAIDPILKEQFGPEICWVWRYLLSSMGLSWQEVDMDAPEYEIGYLLNKDLSGKCRMYIQADLYYWKNRANLRLLNVGETGEWRYPVFRGEPDVLGFLYFDNNSVIFERDLIFYIFWILTGQEESNFSKDKHGHSILKKTECLGGNYFRMALASNIGFNLEKELLKFGVNHRVERWPGGKKAAACVGHDVDYPQIIRWLEPLRLITSLGKNGFKAALSLLVKNKDYWNFISWVEMEKGLNISSAFYFVARQGSLCKYINGTPDPFYDVKSKCFRELFKYLTGEGFEIGLHASYNAFRNKDEFACEKGILEESSGQRICGNRHHYWHLDPDEPEETLFLHEQINLCYDASLIHERYLGWRRGSSWPFFPFYQRERREMKVLQVATVWMDDQLFGYKNYNPGDPHKILCALSDIARSQGGCISIDVHDYVFDDSLFPGWTKEYRRLWEYIIESSDFWLSTPKQIAKHWMNRHNSIVESSRGLRGGY